MSTSLKNGLATLIDKIDAPIASFFTSCVHCGLCAEACLFYTETGDPKYTPIHKLEPLRKVWQQEFTLVGRLMKLIGLSKPLTDAELAEWEPLIYDSCTLCGRCSMVCPVGNDIVYMVRKVREGMVASGHAPQGLKEATIRSIEIGSPMGVTADTLRAQIKHAAKDTGLEIPLDKPGVDYLLLMSSAEIMQFPEFMGAAARIFHQAGISWTLSSTAYEATNSGMQIGSSELAAVMVKRIVDSAEQLKVKTVISPECGHAYTALRWEGPNLIGRKFTFKVKHILEVLDELRAAGKLRTVGLETARMTFHDPCQLVRRGGVHDQPRNLLKMVAPDFIEMEDAGDMNWCCGGGGGVSANERAEPLRIKVFSKKKSQLDKIDVQSMVTACSNCRNMLEEGLEHNHMDIKVLSLTELIAEHLAPNP